MFWTVIAGLSFAAWIYLLLARGFFWRCDQRLGSPPDPAAWPAVVAVIPARNEAEAIAAVVAAHMATAYPGKFSLILVDDASTDGTADIAARAADGAARSFEIFKAPPLEDGWTGKLWAVRAGVARAEQTAQQARYLLLTDADILHAPDTLQRLVAKAESENLALASLMARLDSRGVWGWLLIPAFLYFFQKLYPFALANNPRSKIAAAAGGCMLVRSALLRDAGGMDAIRDRLIDDCALAQAIKSSGETIWIGLADREVISLRDNRSFSSIWNMVARTAYAQLGDSMLMLAAAIIGMGIIYLAPAAVIFGFPLHHNAAALVLGTGGFLMMAASFIPISNLYEKPSLTGLTLPVAAFLYMTMTIHSALRHRRGTGGLWKGRSYS